MSMRNGRNAFPPPAEPSNDGQDNQDKDASVGLCYEPFFPRKTAKATKATSSNAKNNPSSSTYFTKPSIRRGDVLTCWEINVDDFKQDQYKTIVPMCSPCSLYRRDLPLRPAMWKHTQRNVPGYKYHCRTLWKKKQSTQASTGDKMTLAGKGCVDVTPSPPPVVAPLLEKPEIPLSSPIWNNKKRLFGNMAPSTILDSSEDVNKPKRARTTASVQKVGAVVDPVKLMMFEIERLQNLLEQVQNGKKQLLTDLNKKQSVLDSKLKELKVSLEENEALARNREGILDRQKALGPCLEKLVNWRCKKGTHQATKAKALAHAVFSPTVFSGKCQQTVLEFSKPVIREGNPLRDPLALQKRVDLSSGTLNLSALEHLRQIEHDARSSGWIASRRQVTVARERVEQYMQSFAPVELLDNAEGLDGVVFDYEKLLGFILKMYQLDQHAKEGPVQIAITLDGADLSRNLSHVTAGLKITDPRAVDPVTGLVIGIAKSVPYQSRELCYPFKIIMSKDTKTLYDEHFHDFFSFFKKLETDSCFGYKPFIVASPQDGSSFWKSLKRGGACKVKQDFCHCCSCRSDRVELPQVLPCDSCTQLNRNACYHYPVGDAATLAAVREKLDMLDQGEYSAIFATNSHHDLKVRYDPWQTLKTEDPDNIEFNPESGTEQRAVFSRALNHDLQKLQVSRMGALEERRERLLTVLKIVARKQQLEQTEIGANYAGALIAIRQAVPCILHLENRCGEKILKLLLVEAYNSYDGKPKEQEQFVTRFTALVNTHILGKPNAKSNWRMVLVKDSNSSRLVMGDQTMPNCHVRKFIDRFELLSEAVFGNDIPEKLARRKQWEETINLYRTVIRTARNREDFSENDIVQFQNKCDRFFHEWLQLHPGNKAMTNYFHMIGSGHLTYYLREWGNLYKFSQQGWESLNSQMKTYFFRATQRGGYRNGTGSRSRVLPIAKWLQRKWFWVSGNELPAPVD